MTCRDEKKDWETVRRAANEAHEEMNKIFGDEKQREPRRPTINLAGEGRAGKTPRLKHKICKTSTVARLLAC